MLRDGGRKGAFYDVIADDVDAVSFLRERRVVYACNGVSLHAEKFATVVIEKCFISEKKI